MTARCALDSDQLLHQTAPAPRPPHTRPSLGRAGVGRQEPEEGIPVAFAPEQHHHL